MLSHRLDTFFSYPSPATVVEKKKNTRKRTLGKWSLSSALDEMALLSLAGSQIHSLLPCEMKPCILRGPSDTQWPACLLIAQHHLLHLFFDTVHQRTSKTSMKTSKNFPKTKNICTLGSLRRNNFMWMM